MMAALVDARQGFLPEKVKESVKAGGKEAGFRNFPHGL